MKLTKLKGILQSNTIIWNFFSVRFSLVYILLFHLFLIHLYEIYKPFFYMNFFCFVSVMGKCFIQYF